MNSTRGVTFPLFGDYGLQAVSCSFASMYDAYSKFQLLFIAVSISVGGDLGSTHDRNRTCDEHWHTLQRCGINRSDRYGGPVRPVSSEQP